MDKIHKLLLRQLKKRNLTELLSGPDEALRAFLEDVNAAYWQDEDDRRLLERSMELSSNEMLEANRLLEQQRASLVASAKMSTLGETASGIAHEINTPLASIATLAAQLNDIVDDESIDKELLKGHAEKIEKTAHRIGKIVSGLRSFSRNASSDPLIEIRARELLDDALSLCQERFAMHGVKLKARLEPENLVFRGRPSQIAQVVVNLLNNAFDAISSLPEKWVAIEFKETGENTEITVTDSGSGVPPQVCEKMFQPFFSTKEIGKGTGLGLSISRNILKSHGGDLVLNTECKNTQFILRIPRDIGSAKGEAA